MMLAAVVMVMFRRCVSSFVVVVFAAVVMVMFRVSGFVVVMLAAVMMVMFRVSGFVVVVFAAMVMVVLWVCHSSNENIELIVVQVTSVENVAVQVPIVKDVTL